MTRGIETVQSGKTVQIVKRRRVRTDEPPLDLRTPSGKRTLPY